MEHRLRTESADQRLCGGDLSRHRGKWRGARPNDARRGDLAEGRPGRPFGDELEYDFAYYIVRRPRVAKEPGVVAFKQWLLAEARLKW